MRRWMDPKLLVMITGLPVGLAHAETRTGTQPEAASGSTRAPNPTKANPSGGAAVGATALGTTATPEALLRQIHQLNQVEIELGNLAKSKGASQGVRKLGAELAKDHENVDQEAAALADKHNIQLTKPQQRPQAGESRKAKLLDGLRKLKGEAFDRRFLSAAVTEHSKVIDDLKTYRTSASNDLRALIDKMLPHLEAHRERASKLLVDGAG